MWAFFISLNRLGTPWEQRSCLMSVGLQVWYLQTAGSKSPGDLEMQILGSYSGHTALETLGVGSRDFYFFNWRIIALQNFVVFCQTSTWISHRYKKIKSAAPYLGRGVSPHSRPSWPWTWSSSYRPSCSCPATTPSLDVGLLLTQCFQWLTNSIPPCNLWKFIVNILTRLG